MDFLMTSVHSHQVLGWANTQMKTDEQIHNEQGEMLQQLYRDSLLSMVVPHWFLPQILQIKKLKLFKRLKKQTHISDFKIKSCSQSPG